MKLERLPEYLITAVVTILGVLLALYCGRLVGEGRTGTVFAIFASIFGTALVITLRTRVWMLIPILSPFAGQIPALLLPFSVRHLAVMFVAAACAVLIALKVLRRKVRYDFLDVLLLANVVYLATALIRNPVGTFAMGSERIGGRPYFDVAVAYLAYFVLARGTMTLWEARRFPFLVLLGGAGQALIEAITHFSPRLSGIIGTFYTGITTHGTESLRPKLQEDGWRHAYLTGITGQLSVIVCAWFRPATMLNPMFIWRVAGFFILVFAILFTGFRSALVGFGFYFAASTYIRGGMFEVIRTCWLGVAAILIMVSLQGRFVDFPPSVQRALSFLPGKWDPNVVSDSSGSIDWRVMMWKEMLLTDRYIKSKMLGDGFGFSLREFQIQQAMEVTGAELQDYFLVTGSVHSGPLSAIRYVGVVGLALYTWLLIYMIRISMKQINRARGTGFFEPALYVCLPIIYAPFGYYIIFGAFESALPHTIMSVGLLKVLTNALDDHFGAESKGTARHQLPLVPQKRTMRMIPQAAGPTRNGGLSVRS